MRGSHFEVGACQCVARASGAYLKELSIAAPFLIVAIPFVSNVTDSSIPPAESTA